MVPLARQALVVLVAAGKVSPTFVILTDAAFAYKDITSHSDENICFACYSSKLFMAFVVQITSLSFLVSSSCLCF